MTRDALNAITALRCTLLRNGFTPLPNEAKQCFTKGWPHRVVDERAVFNWGRSRKAMDTGIRLDNGLCVIDVDIDEPAAVAAFIERLKVLLPGSLLLMRHGNGAKVAIFVRTSEPFGRISTRRWLKPCETEDDGAHGVEVFGGGSPRQFGSFGSCGPGKSYRWAGRSPLDTCLDELPVFTKAQFFNVLDAADDVLKRHDWQVVKRSTRGENASRPVRDLTGDMCFECNDGVTRKLADLQELARTGGLHDLRCSASWLEGRSARRTDRCIIGATANGCLTIWESAASVTHMSVPVEIDMGDAKAKIRRLREFFDARS